jgi:hypothetical protein
VRDGKALVRVTAAGVLVTALATCSDQPRDARDEEAGVVCRGADVECVLAAALDSLAAWRGDVSVLFVDTALAFPPGFDHDTREFSRQKLAETLTWLEGRIPELHDDTRRHFAAGNDPPVQSASLPRARATLVSLRDSTSGAQLRQRVRGTGVASYLHDAAIVSYSNPGFSGDGRQALVYVEWYRGALSITMQCMLVEKTSTDGWRVTHRVVTGEA